MRNGAALGAALTVAIGLSGLVWADDFVAGPETEGRLDETAPAAGEIETEGDVDWFAIDMAIGDSVAIDMEGAPTGQGSLPDAFLRVFDAQREQLASDDDGGTGFNARVIFEAPATGTFYVAASAFASGTGTYTLSMEAFVPPPDDVGNNSDSAATIASGEAVTGEIELAGDTDWYAIDLQAGQSYAIDLLGAASDQGTLDDPYLTLLNEIGESIQEDDDSAGGNEARLVVTPGTSGRYYVAASGFSSSTGTYRLSVDAYEVPPDDYPEDVSTIGMLAVGGSATGVISEAHDEDWFAVDLVGDQGYAFDLEGAPTGSGTLTDPYLTLIDTNGDEIEWDDDSGDGLNARLQYTPQLGGRYYIAAGAFGDATGTYTLTMSEFVPPPDDYASSTETLGRIASGETVSGRIGSVGDEDWFAVEMQAGVAYTIALSGSDTGWGSLPDPYLWLYDPNGALIDQNDDDGETLNSRLAYTPAMSGTYFIGAGAFGGNTGSYDLTVSSDSAAAAGDTIQIIVEMTDGATLRLLVPRDYLSEMNSIFIGPQ